MTQYRQGDVFLESIDVLPAGLRLLASSPALQPSITLATGVRLSHTLASSPDVLALCLPENSSGQPDYLVIGWAGARLLHDEHAPIDLPPGRYRVIRQREYDPVTALARAVRD